MSKDGLMVGVDGVDPLTKGPDAARELFHRFTRAADGFPLDVAVGAAGNIILNAIRQEYKDKKDADEAINRLLTKLRSALEDHYYQSGGRRSVFPFHQSVVLDPQFMDFAKPYNKR